MWFGPVAVKIWPFQISNTIATVLHYLILTRYLVLCIAFFGLDHCLNPPRHALNQLLTLLSWYLLPFLLNPLPQLMNSRMQFEWNSTCASERCKTVAMVLLIWNGHILTATGPNHMTQGSICSQGFVLCLSPPKRSEIPTGVCGALRAPHQG